MREIVINNFQKGIADSPHLGIGDMRNLDVSSEPGVAQINFRTVNSTATLDFVKWMVVDPNTPSRIFALGDTSKLYKSTDSGDTWAQVTGNTAASGQGMTMWKNAVLVALGNRLEVLESPYTSANWTTSFGSNFAGDTDFHPMITGQDDIVYGGAGRYIFTLQENANSVFQAGTAATYTMATAALDLPQDYRVKCLEELGADLMIGTTKGTNTQDFNVADIFPWDRTSDTFALPVRIAEPGVHQMKNIGNVLYVAAGVNGNYYVTNGTTARKEFTLPRNVLTLTPSTYTKLFPAAIAAYQEGVLLGVGSSTFGIGGNGVWGYKDKAITIDNIVSNGEDGSGTANIEIGAIQVIAGNSYLVSWSYGGVSFGIDKVSTTRYTNYAAFCESQYIPVGSRTNPVPFSEIEFTLTEPLASGQGVRLKYRTNLSESFTTIGTYDAATYGTATMNFIDSLGVTAEGGIQIRCELTTGAGSTTTPSLREIRLR